MQVEIQQLTLNVPGRAAPVVHNVSLALAAGEIGVLMGPSGCGKTSLIRALAGLMPVAQGRIDLGGVPVAGDGVHVPPERRKVGVVFQDYALFPHLSVAQNIAFGMQHQPAREVQARVNDLLEQVQLPGMQTRYPHQLSGGQQQRVALARALAPKPDVLLLDEPFSNLDMDLRERLASDVRQVLKQAQVTALFVTHDQLEAFALGDKVGVMKDGVLLQWDDPYTLYHRPLNRFVAQFTGHGVVLQAQVDNTPQRAVHTALGVLDDAAVCHWAANHHGAMRTDLLLRADDIVHDDDAPMKARIVRKVFRGSTFLYTLELASGEQVLAHVPSHHNHQVGEWVGIRPEVHHVVTFEPNTPSA
ncbi:MAG: ABC transporter ATP-binding protein [Burkholderiaceae bacterium]